MLLENYMGILIKKTNSGSVTCHGSSLFILIAVGFLTLSFDHTLFFDHRE